MLNKPLVRAVKGHCFSSAHDTTGVNNNTHLICLSYLRTQEPFLTNNILKESSIERNA